ncbi:MAG: DUF4411 family protein [Candidatus Solibacter usitatus]|nr:DUF4411 family protein [Candidatus Solibacter usitatus]
MLYLLDANILITAHKSYYPLDQVPEFWSWLKHQAEAGICGTDHASCSESHRHRCQLGNGRPVNRAGRCCGNFERACVSESSKTLGR